MGFLSTVFFAKHGCNFQCNLLSVLDVVFKFNHFLHAYLDELFMRLSGCIPDNKWDSIDFVFD